MSKCRAASASSGRPLAPSNCPPHRPRPIGARAGGVELLESRTLLSASAAPIISSLTDSLTGTSVDTSKWTVTNRGLENNGPAGYNAPTEDPAHGLTLGGTTNKSYWYGSSLESNGLFSSALQTTVSVERVALNGSGTAFRSSLWILQPNAGGQFLHFAQDVNETGWQYNYTGPQYNNTGGAQGDAIAAFNSSAGNRGDHIMKLVYTPLGGNQADVGVYLDGALGATAHFDKWDMTQPFEVILTGEARAAGDTVAAQFKNFDARAAMPSTTAPAAPTHLDATANGVQVSLTWTDNASDELSYHVERSIDGTNFTDIGTVPGVAGTGTTVTFTDGTADVGTTYTYRVRAFNNANGGTFSAYSSNAKATTDPALTSLTDPFTGTSVDTSKWNITTRGIENTGVAGYDAPTESPTAGLRLGGTAKDQYWFGSSLESKGFFSSRSPASVSVERVSLDGTGTAFRSGLWILQPGVGGQFLHFAQDINETGWEYNQTAGNVGTAIPAFNNAAGNRGDHVMKLVYTPLGGTIANIDIYLDGTLGATAHFTNWDNSRPFQTILTGEARAIGDTVSAVFKNFDAEAQQATLPADFNMDGKVDFSDLLILAQNYGKSGVTFSQGDANNDGKVDFADLLILAQNYGKTRTAGASRSSFLKDLTGAITTK